MARYNLRSHESVPTHNRHRTAYGTGPHLPAHPRLLQGETVNRKGTAASSIDPVITLASPLKDLVAKIRPWITTIFAASRLEACELTDSFQHGDDPNEIPDLPEQAARP